MEQVLNTRLAWLILVVLLVLLFVRIKSIAHLRTPRRQRVSWALYFFVFIPLLFPMYGMFRGAMIEPNDRLTQLEAVESECLDGSEARPDQLYCEMVIEFRSTYVDNFFQEIAASATHGMVSYSFLPMTEKKDLEAQIAAERLALSEGTDGSTRFTGSRLEELQASLQAEQCKLNQQWASSLTEAERQEYSQFIDCDEQ